MFKSFFKNDSDADLDHKLVGIVVTVVVVAGVAFTITTHISAQSADDQKITHAPDV